MIDLALLQPEIRPLLAEDRLMERGPGSPNMAARPLLQELQRTLPMKAIDRDSARACLAGLWLYHNFLDESHAISQDLDTIEGSYWHGILHRREPDYGNAKYWFRRVPRHPIFAELCQEAAAIAGRLDVPVGTEFLVRQKTWDASPFIDVCQLAARGPETLDRVCREIQSREWYLLFSYCHEKAFAV